MADKWVKKLSLPKIGKNKGADVAVHKVDGAGSSQAEHASSEGGLAPTGGGSIRDPGVDAAEVLASGEIVPDAMPLPSIQESGTSLADEASEKNLDQTIVEAADRLTQDRGHGLKPFRSGFGSRSQPEIGPASLEEEVDELRAVNVKLREEIKIMSERIVVYERKLASGKGTYKQECLKLREEVAMLQEENSALQYEIDNLNKVASYVGSRVAKVLVGARRANNYNSSLVAELKRWNRKLEVENQRLYAIIDRLQNRDAGSDTASMASELSYHPRDDSALLVKRLEEQNRNLQREISALSADAANLQHLSAGERLVPRAVAAARPPAPSSDCDHSTSSGSADGPKTPSLHEEDSPATSKLEAARAETEALRVQMDSKIEELKSENVRLIEDLARVNDELAVVQAQVTEMEELKAQYDQTCKEVLVLKESVVKLRREAVIAREFRDENMRLEDELARMQKQTGEYEEELAELEAEVDRLQALVTEHPAVTGQVTTLEEQVSHLQATNALLQESLHQLRAQHHTLLEKSAAADARKGDRPVGQFRDLKAPSSMHLGEQLKELRKENAQLVERAMRADALQKELAEAEKQISSLRGAASENAAVEAVHSRRVEQLRAEEEELKKRVAALQESLSADGATSASYSALMKETKSNRKQLDKLLAENRVLGQKKMETELALAEVTASRGAQSTALKQELDAAVARVQDLQQQKDRTASELSVARQEIAALQALQGSSKSEAQAEIDRLKGQFAAEKEKLEATLKEQKSAAAQVSQLRAQLEAVRAEATTKGLRADKLLTEKESLEAKLAAGAEQLALAADSVTLVRQARSEAEALRSQNQTYQEELQALRQHMQEMKKKEIQAPMFSIKGRSESSTVMGLRKENAALKAQAEGMNELKAENEKLRAQLNMRPDASNATAALQKDVEALQATNRSLDARIQQLQVQAAEMEALQGGVLKGRSPQEVVAEVRALFTENGELRREAQKAKALAAENQALQQKLASLQQSRPASTQSTPSASPAQIPSVGPTTPEPQVLGKSGSSTLASHSLKLQEGDGVDAAGPSGQIPSSADQGDNVRPRGVAVEQRPGTGAAANRQQGSSQKTQSRSFWSKQPHMFGTFMKRSALEKAPAPPVPHRVASLAAELEELDAISVELAGRQVDNAYNEYSDCHDVMGFMQALGFDEFANTSLAKASLSAVFKAALEATQPSSDKQYKSPWDKGLEAAAHRKLESWYKSTGL